MKYFFFIAIILSFRLDSQNTSTPVLSFDFNEHLIKEQNDKVILKASDVSLVEDRFGNKESAIYLHGQHNCYLNLGTSSLLKPKCGSISLWVNLDRKVYTGKGYESNPIICTKNNNFQDFDDAYTLFYDFRSDRLMVFSSKDSTIQSGINSLETFEFNRWHHLLFSYDNTQLTFYIDGKLQLTTNKDFETQFNINDSVVVGNGASAKNDRYTRGSVDDILFYNKVLSSDEIQTLYKAPNPNKLKDTLSETVKYALFILFFCLILFIVLFINKQKLKRQKEIFEFRNKINELEIKVIKSQINPHFISNCLAAIQNLVYQNEKEKAVEYIAKFNHLMRNVLNTSDKTFILLEKEIEIIKLNIELEQLRFKNQFDFELNIHHEIDIDDLLIPSLITQPIIENAIWHGLLPLKDIRKPKLIINIFLKKKFIIIEIIDNGVGRKNRNKNNDSKGTMMIIEKLNSINKASGASNTFEIIDLINNENNPIGTKIILQLETL